MAKIKGVELKAVKSFQSREGVGFNSNLYLDGKNIGEAGDHGMGGMVEYRIHTSLKGKTLEETKEEFKKRRESYYQQFPDEFNDDEAFINELYNLYETEKFFKKNVKAGRPFIVHLSYRKKNPTTLDYPRKQDIMTATNSEANLQKIIEKEKPEQHWIYRKLEDFIIE